LSVSKDIFESKNIFWSTQSRDIKKGDGVFIIILMRGNLGITNFTRVQEEKGEKQEEKP